MIQLLLFGKTRLLIDGEYYRISRRKAFALLTLLAIEREPWKREKLASIFWQEHNESSGKTALRQNIAVLKKSPIGNYLKIDRNTIQLDSRKELYVDVFEFLNTLKELESKDGFEYRKSESCLALLEKAVNIYSGEFLYDFTVGDSNEFNDWVLFQTELYRTQYMELCRRLYRIYIDKKKYEKAIDICLKILSVDPYNEKIVQDLMKLYSSVGHKKEGVNLYRRYKNLIARELDAIPSQETEEIYKTMASGEKSAALDFVPNISYNVDQKNFINYDSTFWGREDEINLLENKLSDNNCRLISVLGPGGVGKTCLTWNYINKHLTADFDIVAFISLIDARSELDILEQLLLSIKKEINPAVSIREQLLDFVKDRKCLIVLDNLEHLLNFKSIISELIKKTPGLKIIATSRIRLNLFYEHCIDLKGFRIPDEHSDFAGFKLFEYSAGKLKADFRLKENDYSRILEICRLLSGFPLAIELAASLIRILSVEEILEETKKSTSILSLSEYDSRKNQTINDILEYTFSLLSEPQRELFFSALIFQKKISRSGLEYISKNNLKHLISLVNYSLLYKSADGFYYIHELIKNYGLEKLKKNKALYTKLMDRHMSYYFESLTSLIQPEENYIVKPNVNILAKDQSNIIASWFWAVDNLKMETITNYSYYLYRFFEYLGNLEQGIALFEYTIKKLKANLKIDTEELSNLVGRINFQLGIYNSLKGNYSASINNFTAAEDYFTAAANKRMKIASIKHIAGNLIDKGNFEEAETRINECISFLHEDGSDMFLPMILNHRAYIELSRQEYENAKATFTEAVELCREERHSIYLPQCKNGLGYAYYKLNEFDKAGRVLKQALQARKNVLKLIHPLENIDLTYGYKCMISDFLINLGKVALETGDQAEALFYFSDLLITARETKSLSIGLTGIQGMAGYHYRKEDYRKAAFLAKFVNEHPDASGQNYEDSQKLLEQIKGGMDENEYQEAMFNALNTSWSEVIQQLIFEFTSTGNSEP